MHPFLVIIYLYLWFTFILNYGIVYIVKKEEEVNKRGYKNGKNKFNC